MVLFPLRCPNQISSLFLTWWKGSKLPHWWFQTKARLGRSISPCCPLRWLSVNTPRTGLFGMQMDKQTDAWGMPCTVDAWFASSLEGWELQNHSEHKGMRQLLPTTDAKRLECLGILAVQCSQKYTLERVRRLKNNQYCQDLTCNFLPKLAENYGRAGSILL